MKRRPEGERRRRRRYHPLRAIVVGAWVAAAFGALVAAHGPFWRDVDYWMERAMAHAEAREWPEALYHVGRALDGAPRDPSILTFAGHVHRAMVAWPEAADHFERALDVDRGRPEAALGLAESRLALGDTAKAMSALAELRLGDTNPDQRARAVGLAEAADRSDLALEMLASVPTAENRAERVRLARAVGDHEREVRLLEEAGAAEAGSGPDDAALRRRYARALRDAGRVDEAGARYEALRRDGLLDTESGVAYAWLLNEDGRHAEALAALASTPPTPEVHALAARTALWADDLEEARDRLASLSAEAPEFPESAGSGELSETLAELRRDLAEAEARRARAAAEAEAARLRDTPPADPAGALEFWRGRLAERPDDFEARREVVRLLEAAERFDEARATLLDSRSVEDIGAAAGDEALHAARLSLWSARPDEARRILAAVPNDAAIRGDRTYRHVLAEARLETGDAEGAHRVLRDGDDPLLRARAADASGRAGEAAEHLAALRRSRDLTVEERRWWAGSLWRSGGLEGALAAYEGLSEVLAEDAEVLRAIGDLRLALDDPAGAEEAYRSVLELHGDGDPAAPGLAHALQQQGRTDDAVAVYEAYLDAAPEDRTARLALARALAQTGQFARAGAQYERYAEGAEGRGESRDGTVTDALAEEIANAWMAADDHARAEPWARRAAVAGSEPLARARHAHVLALLGRHADAHAIVDRLEADVESGAVAAEAGLEGALTRAWIERVRGRTLAAIRTLEEQLDPTDTTHAARDARIFLAEVSEARGDVTAARRHVGAARAQGASDTDLEHVTTDLDVRARPHGTAGVEGGSDANRLDVTTAWARAMLRPASHGAPALSGEVRHRRASQRDARSSATAFALGADSLFVSPALRLRASVGLETASDRAVRLLGGAHAELETNGGLRWTVAASRQPVWSEGRRSDVPEYGRVRDLDALDPALAVSEARLSFATTPRSPGSRSVYVEGGASRYSDGNDRAYGYAEGRFPVRTGPMGSLAAVPNVFAEGFSSADPTYASPSSFVAAGLAMDGTRRAGPAGLSARLNPHLYHLPGETGVGLEARLGLTVATALGDVRVTGRYLRQGDRYNLFRVGTEVALPRRGAP